MPHVLTFDLGTTLYKIALFDASLNLLAVERISPPVERTADGRCELNQARFTQALIEGTHRLAARVGGLSDVAAVSFATQANSFALLNETDQPLTPFILWPDRRAEAQDVDWQSVARLADHRRITGVPRLGPLMAIAKFIAMRKQNPIIDRHTRRLVFLSDHFTHWFTGQWITEAGVAGLSGILDVKAMQWWPPAMRMLRLRDDLLPPIARAGTDLGTILPERAAQLGLPSTCRFVVGCLDQYAGAIGTGTTAPGQVCETTGTVLAAVRCAAELSDSVPPGVFQGPAFLPKRFFQMSFSGTSANLLQWYRDQLPDQPSFETLTALAAEATSAAPIEPFDDRASASQSFCHITPRHTRGQIVRGIMQRVAVTLADQIDALCAHHRPTEIHCAGGAARNDLWLQIKADTLQIPMVAMACEEPTSLGAAMLVKAAGGNVHQLASAAHQRKRFSPRG